MSQWHPGKIEDDRSHPRMRKPSMHLQLQHTGDEAVAPGVDTAPHGVETPTPLADWLGFVEAMPSGEDKVSSPDQKSFHTSTTPTNRGRQRWSSGSITLRTV